MISGWTWAKATPKPLASPISSAGTRLTAIAPGTPRIGTCVAMTKAEMVATIPADMSMPPVSMVMVWQAASIASGMANLMVLAIQRSLTMPGRITSSAATSTASRIRSGITGLSPSIRPTRTWSAGLASSVMCSSRGRPGRRRA